MNIGFIIADEFEFAPVKAFAQKNGDMTSDFYGMELLEFGLGEHDISAVLCGIGKVNAAFAASALIFVKKCRTIYNFGLSGAIAGVKKDDIVMGDTFIEHDFDLTPLGFSPGQKPGSDDNTIKSNVRLKNEINRIFPDIKNVNFVTGDQFIASSARKKELVNSFDANAVDMESAAIAYICRAAEVPFLSLRSISDDADENADEVYTEENEKMKSTLFDTVKFLIENGVC